MSRRLFAEPTTTEGRLPAIMTSMTWRKLLLFRADGHCTVRGDISSLEGPLRRNQQLGINMYMGRAFVFCLFAGFQFTFSHGQELAETSRDSADYQRAIELMTAVPTLSDDGDPVALIRAVNHLHAMGKLRAIEILRGCSPGPGRVVRDADGNPIPGSPIRKTLIPSPNHRLALIIPLLFEVDSKGALPPKIWFDPKSRTRFCWFVMLKDDIPLDTLGGCTVSSMPSAHSLIEWAAEHGLFRKEPLRPGDNPLRTADALISKMIELRKLNLLERYVFLGSEQEFEYHIRRQIRSQALSILPGPSKNLDEVNWDALKTGLDRLGVHWSEEKQQYLLDAERFR